ncbi:hypothetical protein [Ammoniphilus sp. 3BR4]|uniref:hypothetical protein n=1 Tax=Ammoniphilus sp. 3BR4 TaxID=3158265 RepID=UPI003466A7ED
MKNKFEIMHQLSILVGKINDIGYKVSRENISSKEMVKQLKEVEKLLHELIEKYTL